MHASASLLACICAAAILPAYAVDEKPLSTPFAAGDNGYHSYRIPALASAPKNQLFAFAEGRIDTWKDKSRTHIVMRRSADGGKTWTPVRIIAEHGTDACMDPCPVIDGRRGSIHLFMARWPRGAKTTDNNRIILSSSYDNGQTWTDRDMTSACLRAGHQIAGFGPGSGIQLKKGRYRGRLIVPSRQKLPDGSMKDVMIYSDNGGKTWTSGQAAPAGGEGQIAETADGNLHLNLRSSGKRRSLVSNDGGLSWGPVQNEPSLQAPEKGCHASVLDYNGKLLYCGPAGSEPTDATDNRGKLMLYASGDSGKTWSSPVLLSSKAAGYSCMAPLPGGKIAVLYEAADGTGFIKARQRPAGWMRLDLIVTEVPRTNSTKSGNRASQGKRQ